MHIVYHLRGYNHVFYNANFFPTLTNPADTNTLNRKRQKGVKRAGLKWKLKLTRFAFRANTHAVLLTRKSTAIDLFGPLKSKEVHPGHAG